MTFLDVERSYRETKRARKHMAEQAKRVRAHASSSALARSSNAEGLSPKLSTWPDLISRYDPLPLSKQDLSFCSQNSVFSLFRRYSLLMGFGCVNPGCFHGEDRSHSFQQRTYTRFVLKHH